uniref:PARP4 MVP-ID C-terminal domain-containing protein n=1 Tax=Naja naja TaxID=35670 RepID=A0A8C6X4J2_NAJNA
MPPPPPPLPPRAPAAPLPVTTSAIAVHPWMPMSGAAMKTSRPPGGCRYKSAASGEAADFSARIMLPPPPPAPAGPPPVTTSAIAVHPWMPMAETATKTFHFCDMPAYENATSDSDIPVQGSAEALSGVWCKSVREEIAFEQPPRPIVCKTVRHTTKKAVPKLPLPFHPEKEILKPSKKGKRSACYKSQKTASEMKLNTTHDAAKSSEENSCQDGFWQFTSELGMLLDLDVHHLIVTFAKNGIQSLGLKGKEKLLQLIATLLVLQAVYFKQLEGLIFKSIMELKDSPPSWALDPVKKATEWAKRANREFPGICQRLQLGKDWDDATKKLLGI